MKRIGAVEGRAEEMKGAVLVAPTLARLLEIKDLQPLGNINL